MKNFKKLVLTAALALSASLANATVIQHDAGTYGYTLGGNDYVSGSYSDFDFAKFSFASEYADTIVISSSFGYMHSHGEPVTALLDVYNGSKWVNVFSSGSITSSADVSAIFANPVTFTGMNISGLRLHSSIYVGNAFHQVSGATTYALSATPAEVPEPATALLLGLGVAGIVALRRKSA